MWLMTVEVCPMAARDSKDNMNREKVVQDKELRMRRLKADSNPAPRERERCCQRGFTGAAMLRGPIPPVGASVLAQA